MEIDDLIDPARIETFWRCLSSCCSRRSAHDKATTLDFIDDAHTREIFILVTKSLLNLSQNDSLEAFLLLEETAQAVVFGTEDFAEGNLAFREKRKPNFRGR